MTREKILELAREQQEPVCIVGELSEPSRSDVINNKGLVIGQYLFSNPAPIPEGWQLVPIEPTEAMLNSISPVLQIAAGNMYKTMLAAARSDRELQHEHTMKQFQEALKGQP